MRFLFHKNNFFVGNKIVLKTSLVAVTDTFSVHCFDQYNIWFILRFETVHTTYKIGRLASHYQQQNESNVKNTHRGVLLLAKLQDKVCNVFKSTTPPWVFSSFFKLHKWNLTKSRKAYYIYLCKKSMTAERWAMETLCSSWHLIFYLLLWKIYIYIEDIYIYIYIYIWR